MKKRDIFIVIVTILITLIVVAVTAIGLYITYQKRLNEECFITYSENLEVEFGKECKLSDFVIDIAEGSLKEDLQISTDVVGEGTVKFQYLNKYGTEKEAEFVLKIKDVTSPIILLNSDVTRVVNSEDDLVKSIISADDYDANPKREIIGEYDLKQVGRYNLEYVITDQSGNETRKQFYLNVIENHNNNQNQNQNTNRLEIENVIRNYKRDNTVIGIDVSRWQGTIDFKKVKESGVKFVIIRLGSQADFGSEPTTDAKFLENFTNAKAAGLKVGVYFYSCATTKQEAIAQAKYIVSILGEYSLDFPIAFDWEEFESFNSLNLSLIGLNNLYKTFDEEIRKSGFTTMLYGSKYYLENMWYAKDYENVWLAHYADYTNYGGKYNLWQLSSVGKVPGISANVDIDIMYDDPDKIAEEERLEAEEVEKANQKDQKEQEETKKDEKK